MMAQQQPPKLLKKQQGAYLIIAMILIIAISAIGIAVLSETKSSLRVAQNYGNQVRSEAISKSLTDYAARRIASFPAGIWPGPGPCDPIDFGDGSNVVVPCDFNSSYPNDPPEPFVRRITSPRYYFPAATAVPWSWWATNGIQYKGSFEGSVNNQTIRFSVQQLGADTSPPYTYTYKITAFAQDQGAQYYPTSVAEKYVTWQGFLPDTGDGTCAGGCYYGQCCDGVTLACLDAVNCTSASYVAYVPPGWNCGDLFGNCTDVVNPGDAPHMPCDPNDPMGGCYACDPGDPMGSCYDPCYVDDTAPGCPNDPCMIDPGGVGCPDECTYNPCNANCGPPNSACCAADPCFAGCDPCVCNPAGAECCAADPCFAGCDPCVCNPAGAECCAADPCFSGCDPCGCNPAGAECCAATPCFSGCDPCGCEPAGVDCCAATPCFSGCDPCGCEPAGVDCCNSNPSFPGC